MFQECRTLFNAMVYLLATVGALFIALIFLAGVWFIWENVKKIIRKNRTGGGMPIPFLDKYA